MDVFEERCRDVIIRYLSIGAPPLVENVQLLLLQYSIFAMYNSRVRLR